MTVKGAGNDGEGRGNDAPGGRHTGFKAVSTGWSISPPCTSCILTSAVAVRRHRLVECLAIRFNLHLAADP